MTALAHIHTYRAGGSGVAGFPMSAVLRSAGAHVGRTGRMLACQTISKFTETTSGRPMQLIYWRALLQVQVQSSCMCHG